MSGPVAVVPLEGRGALPFVDLHGEALFLHAVRALLDLASVEGRVVVTVDPDQRAGSRAALERHELDADLAVAQDWWRSKERSGAATVLVHDPLCPLVPTAFLDRCLQSARSGPTVPGRTDGGASSGAVVAYRPVTDTIKTVVASQITGTLDRDLFGIVTSPVVFSPTAAGLPPTRDFGELATWVRERGPVDLVKAPSLGRRVDDASAVNLLECIDELARNVRES